MEVLAGKNSTKVKINERGASLEFDLSKVYWSSRLAGERQVIMKEILQDVPRKNDTVVVADAFCGVGALCVLLAQTNLKGSSRAVNPQVRILANDWNPDAIEALEKNVKRNRVAPFVDIQCGDAYDFLMDLGLSSEQLPHHVVMNYPLEAPAFLNVLRWWKVPKRKADVVPRIHVYTFARRQGDRSAADVAVDEVAHQLLPEGNKPTPGRLDYLRSLDCDVKAREVRDVAPGKLVICVSFRATALLLRHVQGDFV
jgi:tRNA (guanine37-N1)-methyltransferase